jgi:hypothetical protein
MGVQDCPLRRLTAEVGVMLSLSWLGSAIVDCYPLGHRHQKTDALHLAAANRSSSLPVTLSAMAIPMTPRSRAAILFKLQD